MEKNGCRLFRLILIWKSFALFHKTQIGLLMLRKTIIFRICKNTLNPWVHNELKQWPCWFGLLIKILKSQYKFKRSWLYISCFLSETISKFLFEKRRHHICRGLFLKGTNNLWKKIRKIFCFLCLRTSFSWKYHGVTQQLWQSFKMLWEMPINLDQNIRSKIFIYSLLSSVYCIS